MNAPVAFLVPEINFPAMEAALARLARRSRKLGGSEIGLHRLGFEDWPGFLTSGNRVLYLPPGDAADGRSRDLATGGYRRYFRVAVSGDRPALPGWEFVGAIDRMERTDGTPVGNLLQLLPGVEVPSRFRSVVMGCDHCGRRRLWKKTYLVRNTATGAVHQVGRQCLREFTGHPSPERLATLAELIVEVADLVRRSGQVDEGAAERPERRRFGVTDLLAHTACLVRLYGWKPKTFGTLSTANGLEAWMLAPSSVRSELERTQPISDGDRSLAADTRHWMEGLGQRDGLSDYLSNLSVLAGAGAIDRRNFGLLASAVPSYLRSRELLLSARPERCESAWVGEPEQRVPLVLTLESRRDFPGYMPDTVRTLYRFADRQGNVIVWWSSTDLALPDETEITVRATVKEHSMYSGVRQTVVTRLRRIDPEAPVRSRTRKKNVQRVAPMVDPVPDRAPEPDLPDPKVAAPIAATPLAAAATLPPGRKPPTRSMPVQGRLDFGHGSVSIR